MREDKRLNLLKKLKDEFKGLPIIYITSERKPENFFSTQIAIDIIPLFYNHLTKISSNNTNNFKKVSKISLFICSNGGIVDTPWPLVNLIREYCNELEVVVPYKALSAATLIALGADKIIMSPLSQLSPVDPMGNFQKDGKTNRIEVENVLGFIDFAKSKIGLKDQESLVEILRSFVKEVDPTILGSINRTHSLIRRLSHNLLKTHQKNKIIPNNIKKIVNNLTAELFSHQHFISRNEAKNQVGFGKMIEYATIKKEYLMKEILDVYYYDALETEIPFEPLRIIGSEDSKEYNAIRAIIESEVLTHEFISEIVIQKNVPGQPQTQTQPQPPVQVNVKFQGWKKYE